MKLVSRSGAVFFFSSGPHNLWEACPILHHYLIILKKENTCHLHSWTDTQGEKNRTAVTNPPFPSPLQSAFSVAPCVTIPKITPGFLGPASPRRPRGRPRRRVLPEEPAGTASAVNSLTSARAGPHAPALTSRQPPASAPGSGFHLRPLRRPIKKKLKSLFYREKK